MVVPKHSTTNDGYSDVTRSIITWLSVLESPGCAKKYNLYTLALCFLGTLLSNHQNQESALVIL